MNTAPIIVNNIINNKPLITDWLTACAAIGSGVILFFYTKYTLGLLKSAQKQGILLEEQIKQQKEQLSEQRSFDLRKGVYLEFVGDINTFFEICFDVYAGKIPSGIDVSNIQGKFYRWEIRLREDSYIENWADRINAVCEKIKFCSSAKLQNEINVFADEFKKFHIIIRGFSSKTIDEKKWLEEFNKIRELKNKIVKLMEEDLGIKK